MKDEQELRSLVLRLCKALPKHAVVYVDRKNFNGFEGGNCFVVGPVKGESSKIKVKPVVSGSSATILQTDIHHRRDSQLFYGVTCLK